MARVTPEDVSTDDGVVLVQVGDPGARVVPVLAALEDEVLELATLCTTGALIGVPSKSPNRVAVISRRLTVGHGHPRFSAARFRSTWLAAHFQRMGVLELMRAAGLQGFVHLSDLLPFLGPLAEDEARRLLRGAP